MLDEDIENLKEIVDLNEEELNNNDENVTAILDLIDLKALRNLLQERQQDKDRIKKLEEYANWHIEYLTEGIKDYIDDDKEKNKDIITEMQEDREHWKDILRIINDEKTYMTF